MRCPSPPHQPDPYDEHGGNTDQQCLLQGQMIAQRAECHRADSRSDTEYNAVQRHHPSAHMRGTAELKHRLRGDAACCKRATENDRAKKRDGYGRGHSQHQRTEDRQQCAPDRERHLKARAADHIRKARDNRAKPHGRAQPGKRLGAAAQHMVCKLRQELADRPYEEGCGGIEQKDEGNRWFDKDLPPALGNLGPYRAANGKPGQGIEADHEQRNKEKAGKHCGYRQRRCRVEAGNQAASQRRTCKAGEIEQDGVQRDGCSQLRVVDKACDRGLSGGLLKADNDAIEGHQRQQQPDIQDALHGKQSQGRINADCGKLNAHQKLAKVGPVCHHTRIKPDQHGRDHLGCNRKPHPDGLQCQFPGKPGNGCLEHPLRQQPRSISQRVDRETAPGKERTQIGGS